MDKKKGPARLLVDWFSANGHPWPFRKQREPYPVWIIEVMAQQTQLPRAVEYFERWQRVFPDVLTLAAAGEEEVLRLWEGLGYYSRARNLRKAARIIVEEYGGRFPETAAEWTKLPGVGPYTAAAVASIVYNEPAAAVDANIRRVIARVLGYRQPAGSTAFTKTIEKTLTAWFAEAPPGAVNEALMELGERICLPRRVDCAACPLADACRGRREGDPLKIPPPAEKKKSIRQIWETAAVFDPAGRLWMIPAPGPVWKGLWILPRVEAGPGAGKRLLAPLQGAPVAERQLKPVTHAYTVYRLEFRVTVYRLEGTGAASAGAFFHREELAELPLPSAMRKIFRLLFPEN